MDKNKCHTYDRDDYGAQLDGCGIGRTSDWTGAVNEMFAVTYWPYANPVSPSRGCIEKFFLDSRRNMELEFGLFGAGVSFAVLIVILAANLLI